MNENQTIIEKARHLVGHNKLGKALQVIKEVIIDNADLLNEETIIRGRFASFKKSENGGYLSSEEKIRIENKLRISILNLITKTEAEISNVQNFHLVSGEISKSNRFKYRIIGIPLAIIISISLCSFIYIKKVQKENFVKQEELLSESNLVIYLKNESNWDTINNTKDISKLVKCRLNEKMFSIEFNLAEQNIPRCEDVKFFLSQGFMDDLGWPHSIQQWDKEFPDNGLIYKALSPCQIDKLLFNANFVKD